MDNRRAEAMEEPRTKLLCNTGIGEHFRLPDEEGIWHRTAITKKQRGPKQYLVYGPSGDREGIRAIYVPASTRVELVEKEEEYGPGDAG